MSEQRTDEQIKEAVRQAYGSLARRFVEAPAQASCCGPSEAAAPTESQESTQCCGPAEAPGSKESQASTSCCEADEAGEGSSAALRLYSPEELAGLPESVTGAVAGCGNPTAIAALQPGEVVLDLGSGGGIDCFLAAKKVGSEGRVIGLDMTPEMIKLARRNAKKMGVTNVEFRYGEMEEIPLPDASVDVIVSNCVINLSPDKDAVFGEAYRVLRPGGRMSVSDIVVDGDLPAEIRSRLDAWAGCIAGALEESVYLDKIRAAGFEDVEIVSRVTSGSGQGVEGEAQVAVAQPDGQVVEGEEAKALLAEAGLSPQDLVGKIASIKVTAHKPA